MSRTIRIGTRGSQLALWQAGFVQSSLEKAHPEVTFERVIIKTEGDQNQTSSLTNIGGQGVFTKAIEDALLENRIDIAVHSLKDLPSALAPGLILSAVPQRGPVEDALVTEQGISVNELPHGATVASGSLRRRSQLLKLHPDLKMADLRGNIDTRLRKLHENNFSAIVMARAALFRLKLDDVRSYVLSTEEMIPAVGQGAIGLETREQDSEVRTLLESLNHPETFAAVTAERAFLNELDSGCQFPVAAHAFVKDDQLTITGYVGSEDGQKTFSDEQSGTAGQAEQIGRSLARQFINQGADSVLREFRA